MDKCILKWINVLHDEKKKSNQAQTCVVTLIMSKNIYQIFRPISHLKHFLKPINMLQQMID